MDNETEISDLISEIASITEWLGDASNPKFNAVMLDWLFDSTEVAVEDIRKGRWGMYPSRAEVEEIFIKDWTEYRKELESELAEYLIQATHAADSPPPGHGTTSDAGSSGD